MNNLYVLCDSESISIYIEVLRLLCAQDDISLILIVLFNNYCLLLIIYLS